MSIGTECRKMVSMRSLKEPLQNTEGTPLDSLDHWLHMIDMCASHDKNEDN